MFGDGGEDMDGQFIGVGRKPSPTTPQREIIIVALDHDSTLVAVVEMSGTSWLVLAIVPGIDRRPLQKLPVDENRLFREWAPSPWSLANDAHEASWSRSSGPTEYKVVRLRGPNVASRRTRELRLGTADHPTAAAGQRWRLRSMS